MRLKDNPEWTYPMNWNLNNLCLSNIKLMYYKYYEIYLVFFIMLKEIIKIQNGVISG